MARPSKLAIHPNNMVLTALRESSEPMTAYGLLKKLEPFGVKSVPIIYRALDYLEQRGEIHKIKELAAYIACGCDSSHSHSEHNLSLLTICKKCKSVDELHDHKIIEHILGLRKMNITIPENSLIELPIICDNCILC